MRHIRIPGNLTFSGKEVVLNASQFGTLTKIIFNVITQELPSLEMLSKYFNTMIDIFISINLPILWETPAGLKIRYTNIKFNSVRLKPLLVKSRKLVTIKLPTQSIDKAKVKQSLMPNFIHSLDAANVHLLLRNILKYKLPVFTVHDCFASTPNNMLLLEKLVKEAFIEIYFKSEGYLLKVHRNFLKNILASRDWEISIENENVNTGESGEFLDKEEIIELSITKNKSITLIDNTSEKIIVIPPLPIAYYERNSMLKDFIKGLFNSKYFIG